MLRMLYKNSKRTIAICLRNLY